MKPFWLRDSTATEPYPTLEELRVPGGVFCLHESIHVDVFCEDDLWYVEFKPLSILSFGKSKAEAVNSFSSDFLALWESIAQSPDETLTNSAIAVKKAFQQVVDSFESET